MRWNQMVSVSPTTQPSRLVGHLRMLDLASAGPGRGPARQPPECHSYDDQRYSYSDHEQKFQPCDWKIEHLPYSIEGTCLAGFRLVLGLKGAADGLAFVDQFGKVIFVALRGVPLEGAHLFVICLGLFCSVDCLTCRSLRVVDRVLGCILRVVDRVLGCILRVVDRVLG